MKQLKPKIKGKDIIWIYSDLYKMNYYFYEGSTADLAEYINHYYLDPGMIPLELKSRDGVTYNHDGKGIFVAWKQPKHLVHELFHVVEMTMNRINVPMIDQTAECWAYFLEWMYGEVMKKREQKQKKRKNK